MGVARFHRAKRPAAVAAQRVVVAQAEAYLRAHVGAGVQVTELGRVVGMSVRGLRNAFYGVHAMSPKQWMLAERLQGARRALRDRDARPTTVTSVATDHGFYELGRFAAAYRGAFGEAPSVTLRNGRERTDAGRT